MQMVMTIPLSLSLDTTYRRMMLLVVIVRVVRRIHRRRRQVDARWATMCVCVCVFVGRNIGRLSIG
jgi:hypothetical protein